MHNYISEVVQNVIKIFFFEAFKLKKINLNFADYNNVRFLFKLKRENMEWRGSHLEF